MRTGRSPLPTLAAVNGAAVGAGMNLALVCDVRIAARRAKFDTRFLQLGLHPGGGHTWMFRRIAGPQAVAVVEALIDPPCVVEHGEQFHDGGIGPGVCR